MRARIGAAAPTIGFLAGFAATVAGLALIYLPAALIVGGVAVCAGCVLASGSEAPE